MKVMVHADGMECEVVEGGYLTFKRTLSGLGSAQGIEGCIMWEDLPPHLLKKIEPLLRRANNNAFDLIRTVIMSHTLELTNPLSGLDVIPGHPVALTAPQSLEDAACSPSR